VSETSTSTTEVAAAAAAGVIRFPGFGSVDTNFDGESLLPLLFQQQKQQQLKNGEQDQSTSSATTPAKQNANNIKKNATAVGATYLAAPAGWRDRLLLEYWGCCGANGSYVWRGGCRCNDPYPNQCGVGECGADGVHDSLLDAPSNTWVALRVRE
jgi:hypothetical protein